jgi:hypothetical protein
MSIEKRKLLLAMGGIVGSIQIDGDPAHPLLQSSLLTTQHRVGQRFGAPVKFLGANRILKAAQCRLGG